MLGFTAWGRVWLMGILRSKKENLKPSDWVGDLSLLGYYRPYVSPRVLAVVPLGCWTSKKV